jgi:hypothetical protein
MIPNWCWSTRRDADAGTVFENPENVMPGLDPGIHHSSEDSFEVMDCRVKPGNDDF